jgi:hypothetical protein
MENLQSHSTYPLTCLPCIYAAHVRVQHIGCFSSAGLTGDAMAFKITGDAMANLIALIGCALQQAKECDEPS